MQTAAIWGAGFIAQTHVDALRANGINIALVVSRTREGAQEFAAAHGIPSASDDPTLLFDESIDCVHVCTPPNLHYSMVRTLLEHGKNVVCEKPLCLDEREAEELYSLARESGLVCAVNFNVRFHDACQRAHALTADPAFGRILLVHGTYLQEFGALPTAKTWRYDERMAGKMHAVTEIGSHWMDLAEFVSGRRICAVSAQFDRFHPVRYVENGMMYAEPAENREPFAVESEDAAVLSLCFEGGAIGSCLLSELSQGRTNRLTLEVTGEKQNLWWDSENHTALNSAERGKGVHTELYPFGGGFADTFRRLLTEVYADIAAGKVSDAPRYPSFADGYRSVKLCKAVYDSAMNDAKWVEV